MKVNGFLLTVHHHAACAWSAHYSACRQTADRSDTVTWYRKQVRVGVADIMFAQTAALAVTPPLGLKVPEPIDAITRPENKLSVASKNGLYGLFFLTSSL